MNQNNLRHFLSILDWDSDHLLRVLYQASAMKKGLKAGEPGPRYPEKVMGMIFQKPSLRTRVSFEAGMYQLGGTALYLSPAEIDLGKRESVEDVARVLGRYVDIIMARVFGHDDVVKLAAHSPVPVINGLSDYNHPCQVVCDLLTILEKKGQVEDVRVTYVGDGNNLANSWLNAASLLPFELVLCVPEGYDADDETFQNAKSKGTVSIERNPAKAVAGSDVIYTDVWASMGQEAEAEKRKAAFKGFRVDSEMVSHAKPDSIVMHCLPAHRGEEITDEVVDGPQSVVFDQAENRLHGQKAIICDLLEDL